MGINIGYILWGYAAVLKGVKHGVCCPFPVLCGGSDMISVAGAAVAKHLRVNAGPSFSGMLQFLQNQDSCPFSHDKSAAVLVKGKAAAVRVIHTGKGGQGAEACNSQRGNGALRPPCHHHVRFPVLDTAECLSDGVGSCGAGSHYVEAFPFQTKLNGNISGRHVGDHQRDKQGIYPGRPLAGKLVILSLHGLQASDPGAHGAAHTIRILSFHLKPRIRNSLLSSGYSILGERLHPSGRSGVHKFFGVKILYLGCHMAFVVSGIKTGDRAKAMLSFFHGTEKIIYVKANGGNGSHSCYHYSSAHTIPHFCCAALRAYQTQFSRKTS